MKKLMGMLVICALQTSVVFAQAQKGQQADDLFSTGTDEFRFQRFDDNQILLQIDADANLVCHDGLCTLTAVTTDSRNFSASFSIGNGPVGFGGLGGNLGGAGGGTFIGIGGNNMMNQDYWGVTLRYNVGHCEQRVNVPRSLYYSINRYMYGLMTEEGGTRRGFTPADEAMIMFYTTIMKQANGCTNTSNF